MNIRKILSISIFLICIIIYTNLGKVYAQNSVEPEFNITYETHVQDIGWQGEKQNGEIAGTEGKSKRLEAIKINSDNLSEGIKIKYKTHVQDIGWQEWKYNGEISGTEGQSKRLEAIKIELEETEEYSIMYRVHVQDIGWQEWKYDGETAGTEGQSKRLEAIEIKIVEKNAKVLMHLDEAENGKIYYKNEKINVRGWKMANVSNTKVVAYLDGNVLDENIIKYAERPDVITGVNGYGNAMQNPTPQYSFEIDMTQLTPGQHTIEIDTIDKNGKLIGYIISKITYDTTFHVSYSAHVQDVGWQGQKQDGEMAGTEGRALRVEALKINLINAPQNAKIKYKTHVQDIGWQGWKYDGDIAGTIEQSKRVEAVKIELENADEYSIEYRTHVQDVGWTSWYIDGETSGSIGKSLRVEAVEIRIVPKYKRHYIGIDISHWQGNVDYNRLIASKKIDFMIAKVGWYSESRSKFMVDSQFERNYDEAKKGKIPLGIYLYSYATNEDEARREAENLIKYLNTSNKKEYELPIFFDIEDKTQESLSKDTATKIITAFGNVIKNAGYNTGIYANLDWYTNKIDLSKIPEEYSLWIAHYDKSVTITDGIPDQLEKYAKTHDIWQYTQTGKIDGISGNVDFNVCYKKYF